jgi:hypothetical protein
MYSEELMEHFFIDFTVFEYKPLDPTYIIQKVKKQISWESKKAGVR